MAINRDKVLEAAQKYVEKKKYDKAVAELRKLVEADPNDARTLLKIGDLRAINPYNPFLAMWTTITRRAKWYDGQLHPEEALSRRQAIEFYTRHNAHLIFWEKEIGSLETGKRADFIVIDRDLLMCPEDAIKETRVLQTWIEGRKVFERTGG